MNKNIFILMICLISFLSSCNDDTYNNEQIGNEPSETFNAVLDSLAIYKIQTDKSMILNNLIHYQSCKYVLDLSIDDAQKLGITELMYNQVLEHVNQLNSNFKNNPPIEKRIYE